MRCVEKAFLRGVVLNYHVATALGLTVAYVILGK